MLLASPNPESFVFLCQLAFCTEQIVHEIIFDPSNNAGSVENFDYLPSGTIDFRFDEGFIVDNSIYHHLIFRMLLKETRHWASQNVVFSANSIHLGIPRKGL